MKTVDLLSSSTLSIALLIILFVLLLVIIFLWYKNKPKIPVESESKNINSLQESGFNNEKDRQISERLQFAIKQHNETNMGVILLFQKDNINHLLEYQTHIHGYSYSNPFSKQAVGFISVISRMGNNDSGVSLMNLINEAYQEFHLLSINEEFTEYLKNLQNTLSDSLRKNVNYFSISYSGEIKIPVSLESYLKENIDSIKDCITLLSTGEHIVRLRRIINLIFSEKSINETKNFLKSYIAGLSGNLVGIGITYIEEISNNINGFKNMNDIVFIYAYFNTLKNLINYMLVNFPQELSTELTDVFDIYKEQYISQNGKILHKLNERSLNDENITSLYFGLERDG